MIVGMCIVAVEWRRYLRYTENRLDPLFFSMLWFLVIYIFAPVCVEFAPDINDRLLSRNYAYATDPSLSLGFIAAVVLGWICILLGHQVGCRIKKTHTIVHALLSDRILIKHARVLFLLALFFVVLFVLAYGRNVLTTSIRMGELELSQIGSFFRQMATISVIALYMEYILILRRKKLRSQHLPWLIPNIVVAGYIILQSGGRGGMIMPFLMCYLLYSYHHKKIVINHRILGLLGVMVFFVLFGRFVITRYVFSDNPGEMIYELQNRVTELAPLQAGKEVLSNFTYAFISVNEAFSAIYKGDVEYRYFKDIPLGVLFYARLLGIPTDASVTYYNTYIISGQFRSTIPPSLIGLGIYSLGWAGIAIISLLYGIMIGIINKCFYRTSSTSPFVVYKIMIGMLLGGFVANGDPRVLTLKVLPLLVCIIILKIQVNTNIKYRMHNINKNRAL